MVGRNILKNSARAISILFAAPFALLTMFGRIMPLYLMFAHLFAIFPGVVGDYFRGAYYFMTLRKCSIETRIAMGTFFAHPEAAVGPHVGIGEYCVLGRANIGERTLIASHAEIISGGGQHTRDEQGRLKGEAVFVDISIGSDCWIGAGAIVMANVGNGATVAAGAVVSSPVAPGTTVAGNPARPVRLPIVASK